MGIVSDYVLNRIYEKRFDTLPTEELVVIKAVLETLFPANWANYSPPIDPVSETDRICESLYYGSGEGLNRYHLMLYEYIMEELVIINHRELAADSI